MRLRVVPTKAHGVFDLVAGPALAATPNLLRLNGERGSTLPPRLAGVLGTGLSALTDYETGAVRVIPLKAHLAFDGASGAALASAPWLSGARKNGVRHWLPHAVVGLAGIALSLTTRTEPDDRRRNRTPWLVAGIAAAGLAVAGAVAARKWASDEEG
ncbi:MAG TPA: hypothetical protein VGW30_01670 [Gaiellaceae bacterium]|nr:hypothetical protein [Gaiellaceae bacterium]